MPYRGKPSQGCLFCRRRKIKCDQRPGSCLNCEKSSRECPGYRNQRDLMFLDETQDVLNKARGRGCMSSASRQISPQPTFCSTLPVISRSRAKEDMRLLSEPPYALETQALAFYYHNFAIKEGPQTRLAGSRGLASAPSHNALYQSMLALGYAGLSQCASMGESRLQAPGFAEKAYIEAVRAVTFAVTRPEETAIDGTLLAVHLMAMYETTAQRRKDVELSTMLSAWSNHVHGAAALLEARGTAQFTNPESMRLFDQTVILLCMDCIKHGLPLPENICKMYLQARQRMPERRTPRLRSLDLLVQFCNFYGQVRSHRISDYQVILAQAQELDAQAQAVFEHADHTMLYGTVPNKPKDLSEERSGIQFPVYHHKYPSFHAAELWNGNRVIRILLNQMTRSFLLRGMAMRPPLFSDSAHTRLLQRSMDTLRILQDEVICSLPQYLGLRHWEGHGDNNGSDNGSGTPLNSEAAADATSGPSFLWNSWPNTREAYQVMSPGSPNTTTGSSSEHDKSATTTTTQMMASMTPPLIKIGGGSNLPWVLFTLGGTDIATEPLKRWLVARLRYIGEKMSVRQALFLADKLEQGDMNEAWYRNYSRGRGD